MTAAADPLHAQARRLADALAPVERGLVLVVTGAGVSLASGLATFRGSDPGAIWKRDVMEMATLDFFRRDPVGSWRWYQERFDKVLEARPNPAHLAIAALERWQRARGGDFLLVTQNIDVLHERAGSREMIKVHGSADRVRCQRDGCRLGAPAGSLPLAEVDFGPFRADPSHDTLPRCPDCGGLLRPHVLWFDELYQGHADYRWEQVMQAIERMHVALCVGTSFSVGLTEVLLQAAFWSHTPVLSIDPGEATVVASRGLEQIRARAEELLPRVCAELGAELPA
jgi:NAD-dependent protein deacetylase/lipoamidase